MAQAGVPLVYHLGAGRLPSEIYTRNGLPAEPAFHGGDGRLQAHDYVATPHPVIETITALIMDGVLHRHPGLRLGLVEFGGCWLPGWLRFLDSAMDAFRRTESRLQTLDLKLSEYVIRQVRCTIFPHEDLGWSIAQSSPDIFMFSSDYPHIEGGRDPIARFEASMDRAAIPASAREQFYCGNFEDFVGGNVPLPLTPALDAAQRGIRP
jgi:predicted TIM-barrel fold metal-dependent hydrolase